jgi:IS30 family transposase
MENPGHFSAEINKRIFRMGTAQEISFEVATLDRGSEQSQHLPIGDGPKRADSASKSLGHGKGRFGGPFAF